MTSRKAAADAFARLLGTVRGSDRPDSQPGPVSAVLTGPGVHYTNTDIRLLLHAMPADAVAGLLRPGTLEGVSAHLTLAAHLALKVKGASDLVGVAPERYRVDVDQAALSDYLNAETAT